MESTASCCTEGLESESIMNTGIGKFIARYRLDGASAYKSYRWFPDAVSAMVNFHRSLGTRFEFVDIHRSDAGTVCLSTDQLARFCQIGGDFPSRRD
jgi:hypothetical protein